MVSPKASLLSALNVLRAAAQAGNALSHPRPLADRTARGACEKTYAAGPFYFPSNGRRSGRTSPSLPRLRNSRSLDPPASYRQRRLYPIPSILFRAVQSLIGGLQYKLCVGILFRRSCDPYAHRYRKRSRNLLLRELTNRIAFSATPSRAPVAPLRSPRRLPPVSASHVKFRRLDRPPQLLQMLH